MRPLSWMAAALALALVVVPAAAQNCEEREPCCEDPNESSSSSCKNIDVVASRDPNDKAGPPGSGAARYITGGQRLTYTIFFENKSTATAPAAEVRITDHLNLNGLDPQSFSLESFGFGSTQRAAVPNLATYATSVDLRPGRNAIVNFTAALDTASGELIVRFVTIDPATKQPTDDPFGGFLPPNVTPPAGEGFITFSISQRPGIPTGTILSNVASIVFDLNPPIDTPVWSNTVDRSAPESQVAALPAVTGPKKFQVSWAGDDFDSGLRHFSVFVSRDGGPHVPWLSATTALADTFYGEHGHSYAFYSIAEDSVGNVEAAPPIDDATTTIDTTTAAIAALVSVHAQRDRVELTWFVHAEGGRVRLWKGTRDTPWAILAEGEPNASGQITFVDVDVAAGRQYGYRLGVLEEGVERFVGESWLWVPGDFRFALRGSRPNPAHGRVVADFSLADEGETTLELFSVSGRRIATHSVGKLRPGDHQIPIGTDFRLPSGVYLLRLSQGQRSETRKVAVK